MLKNILESKLVPLSDSDFREVLDLATSDIKINRVAFCKRTSLQDAIEIAVSCFISLSRGEVA